MIRTIFADVTALNHAAHGSTLTYAFAAAQWQNIYSVDKRFSVVFVLFATFPVTIFSGAF